VPYVSRNKSFGCLWEPKKDCLNPGAAHSALENISTIRGKKSLSSEEDFFYAKKK